jgi:signal transduction histidine kinase
MLREILFIVRAVVIVVCLVINIVCLINNIVSYRETRKNIKKLKKTNTSADGRRR